MAKRSRTNLIFNLDTREIQAELNRRQRGLPKLYAQLRKAEAKVSKIVSAISRIEGSPLKREPGRRRLAKAGAARKRHKNERSLIEVLADVLKGKTLSVSEAVSKAKSAGYKTTSPNFRVIVNQALIKSNLFKKVSHGKYTAK